ncbi:hypothetical protein AcW2_007178 [Taiwanofungus camphoratus]|nr:hypothetical protein AcW2_007178 [Antrodia cinnamomea]
MTTSTPRDIRDFLDGYPNSTDRPLLKANLLFYQNKLRCRPDNLLIDEIHEQWQGDYAKLEYKHGFIQWLFPIPEHGMNAESQPLQKHEAAAMRADPAVMRRILRSYSLMLNFYGMRLESPDSGLLARSTNYPERYRNLIRSPHNNLRITRILKCLSVLGLERLNAGFLLHVLAEQGEHNQLNTAVVTSSIDRWWAACLRDEGEREWVSSTIKKVRSGDQEWTRETYVKALELRKQGGMLARVGN